MTNGIHIVDSKGKTIYYNSAMEKLEGVDENNVIGKKITEYLENVNEENSTLMNAIKTKKKYIDVAQQYSNRSKKKITTVNTTVPVIEKDKVIAAIEISKDMTKVKELHEKIFKLEANKKNIDRRYSFKDIIGSSDHMRTVVNKAMRASLSNSSILIYGETGSGKEVIAQSIHYNGVRRNHPFIAVNCAAIPSALLEGMFFGTVKGSFTGAENKKGLFEEANRGTLLLDELNSLDTYLQSKLLRVLQDGYIRPLGSSKIIDVDVRIIATLNEEPERLIEEGKLRKDFYYRLGVVRINIPPLRERKEDIEEIANHFINYYNELLGKEVIGIEDDVIDKFLDYDWPGNIRELKNVIEAAMNMGDDYRKLSLEYFENDFLHKNEEINEHELNGMSLSEYLEDIEKQLIINSLNKNNYNISKTAKELKITRQALQYKIKKYELCR